MHSSATLNIQSASKFGKPSSGHRSEKGQSSSQFPRRAVWKTVQTTGQLHPYPTLVRLCSKFCTLGFSIIWTENFQTSKLGIEKAEETAQIANICWITDKAREFQKNIYLCFIDFAKAFEYVDHNKL